MKPLISRLLLLGASVVLLSACDKAAPNHPPRPIPEVSVVTAHAETVPLSRELVGRLAPTRLAQVRARVTGIVLKRLYTEGTDVKQGQALFQIDPAPLLATLHAQNAALAKAQADAANAALTAKRYRNLSSKGVLSQQDLDTALANERTTAAAVKLAEANVESARLDLGYATVTAPIAGRAGRALVTEGALVDKTQATELTTVEQIDPIYVNFSQSVSELEQLQHNGPKPTDAPQVTVLLAGGKPYSHPGTLDFTDRAVDPGTGAVSLRAIVPNPQHRLLPGMFVKLRLVTGHIKQGFVLPQAAIGHDTHGAYVFVVNTEGKVEQRRVQTHGMTQADWIVTGALHDGDQVIVDGLQKVKPGVPAKAVAAGTHAGDKTAGHHTATP